MYDEAGPDDSYDPDERALKAKFDELRAQSAPSFATSFEPDEHALKAKFDELKARSAAAPEIVAERFVIIKVLGVGGMGEVHEAYDTQLERKVALKLVTSGSQERLLREARA